MTLPDSPLRDTIDLNDGTTALLRWPNPGAPRLVFAHANGFCAAAYRQTLSLLSARFDVVAPDLRGHGRTTLPADPATHRSWHVYAEDLTALYAALDRPPDIVAGHSMGATSTLLAAADAGLPIAMIEPVILPAPVYLAARTPILSRFMPTLSIAEAARRRTRRWDTREAAFERYAAKPPFDAWAPGVLNDYLEDGLKDAPDGVALACDPDWEAASYEAQANDPYPAARKAGPRARALKAERGSTLLGASALSRRGVGIDRAPGLGHLLPMEDPKAAAAFIAAVWEARS